MQGLVCPVQRQMLIGLFRFGERGTVRHATSKVDLLDNCQSVFQLNTEVTHRAINLCIAKQ